MSSAIPDISFRPSVLFDQLQGDFAHIGESLAAVNSSLKEDDAFLRILANIHMDTVVQDWATVKNLALHFMTNGALQRKGDMRCQY